MALARAAFSLPAGAAIGLLILLAPINLLTVQFDWQFELSYPIVAPLLTLAAYVRYWLILHYAVALLCLVVGVFIGGVASSRG